MRKAFYILVIAATSTLYGCQDQSSQNEIQLGPDEGINRTKISRFFQSNPVINKVQIRTPLSDAVATEFINKLIVFQRNIGEDDEDFELYLNGRNNQELNDVNKGRIEIYFADGKVFKYSKKSSRVNSMVFDDGLKGIAGNIGTIHAVLMGNIEYEKLLIEHMKKKKILSFTLEGFETKITDKEADEFRKNINTVMTMK
ncbi:hypothetical protein FGF66_11530 [Chlorobaculum thiosulfatiphilum]|uniref:Lipoprotein n=1 Tax=Chlorobaculum thiosulfatiphilum TaxID=115852 RepID=A0A5C4S125_CHLTI|nr:hypothetical protein [Chlorobaculum thiosulfatiphilum]TNJ36767.1 hypothetical protein FGF66_11530 [Chlorobaculum thiosulfatiphilum]